MSGRLVAVVGPSGVGKDSVMRAIAERDGSYGLVRRVITREPGGDEDCEAVDAAEFARRKKAGGFCLDWQAHGLRYGIPVTVEADVEAGANRLVNLSRSVLGLAAARFPAFAVIVLSATPETLAKRLAGRGRETVDDIARRLAREGACIPDGLHRIDLPNDGALSQTVDKACAALREPVRA